MGKTVAFVICLLLVSLQMASDAPKGSLSIKEVTLDSAEVAKGDYIHGTIVFEYSLPSPGMGPNLDYPWWITLEDAGVYTNGGEEIGTVSLPYQSEEGLGISGEMEGEFSVYTGELDVGVHTFRINMSGKQWCWGMAQPWWYYEFTDDASFTAEVVPSCGPGGCVCTSTCLQGQTQRPFPDCSCVMELSEIRGRIYYEDYSGGSPLLVLYGGAPFVPLTMEKKELPYVKCKLLVGTEEIEGHADAHGDYSFTFSPSLELEDGEMGSLTVILEDEQERFYVAKDVQIIAQTAEGYSAYGGLPAEFSRYFELAPTSGSVMEYDFEMDNSEKWMKEGAKIYFNIHLAADYAETVLNEPMDKGVPMPVLITPEGDTAYEFDAFGIAIGDVCAAFSYPDAPMNREWHEYGHHVQYDGFSVSPGWTGDTNHGSYGNPSSTDSLVEGWAEVYAARVSGFYGNSFAHLYPVGWSVTNLEMNLKIVGKNATRILSDGTRTVPPEEYVAASLLWDIMDGKNAADEDYIDVSDEAFWKFFKRADFRFSDGGSGHIYNLADLYDALNSQSSWNLKGDDDKDGRNNLDELFISHGIFQDDNKNGVYDAGEKIGVTMDTRGNVRRKIQPLQGTQFGIDVKSDSGKQIDSVMVVQVEFEPPYGIYDYEYAVFVPAGTDNVNINLPPPYYSAQAEFTVSYQGYGSDGYTITNEEYWEKVDAASVSGEPFDNHSFTLDYMGGAPCESDSDCDGEGEVCVEGICKKDSFCVCLPLMLLLFIPLMHMFIGKAQYGGRD
jgi:hypothetical protein